jgi:hypothetical protein
LLHQHLQLVKLGVAGCNITKQWRLVSKVELDQSQSLGFTVNGLQQLLALMLPFELGDSSLLGTSSSSRWVSSSSALKRRASRSP